MDIREHFQKFQLKSIIRKRKRKKKKKIAVTIRPALRQFLGYLLLDQKLGKNL